jgi:hypothetical protein
MTMLNAAPTATAAPAAPAQGAPAAASAGSRAPRAPDLHVLGSGGTAGPAEVKTVTVPLDAFAKQGGPDAAVQTANGVVSVHAVFQLDDKTHELTVAIVDQNGQLIRMIPPHSVARMIAAMAMYRGR